MVYSQFGKLMGTLHIDKMKGLFFLFIIVLSKDYRFFSDNDRM